MLFYGYGAPGYLTENEVGSIEVGKDDPLAIYTAAVYNYVTSGGDEGASFFSISLQGDRTALVSGKEVYLNGEVVPSDYADGPWSYMGFMNLTFREYSLPSLLITHGNTYLVEIK